MPNAYAVCSYNERKLIARKLAYSRLGHRKLTA